VPVAAASAPDVSRPSLGECAVEAEAIAQLDAEDVSGSERRLEEALHEGVPAHRRFPAQVRSPSLKD
jgi:hypothetical protein